MDDGRMEGYRLHTLSTYLSTLLAYLHCSACCLCAPVTRSLVRSPHSPHSPGPLVPGHPPSAEILTGKKPHLAHHDSSRPPARRPHVRVD
ncbi:hypothetical protein BZA05DRAFT_394831 [Tricharina praecox]|uniref:uncharacterized protein n=1 Tax=Tricharina praecox TaxID=43433 RepID=UPI0022207EE2|nr:uncharacterized protein BZA05DRAFT_394831 [Tricharina praecox]KAI5853820.1 hypothetical protein BZA05DRAFT_394831 [Tricharina praecox]